MTTFTTPQTANDQRIPASPATVAVIAADRSGPTVNPMKVATLKRATAAPSCPGRANRNETRKAAAIGKAPANPCRTRAPAITARFGAAAEANDPIAQTR